MYRAFATRDPNSEFSPGLSQQAIEAYRKGGFTALVLEGKREYVALYNYGTTFWQGRNKADYPNIAKELKLNLKDVATYFHAEAQKTKKADQFLEAARWYRTYLESFPDDPDSFGTNYLLSETLYSAGDFQDASVEFTKTAYNYPRNQRSAAAAYAALGAYTQVREQARRPPRRRRRTRRSWTPASSSAPASRNIRILRACSRAPPKTCSPRKDLQRSIEVANLVLAHQPPADAAQAPHRLHHHRPVAVRPAELRRGREGFHRRARPAAAQ